MKSFDNSIRDFYKWRASAAVIPKLALHFTRTASTSAKRPPRRRKAAKAGVQVPPFMILSVTRRCNCRCAGCFVQEHNRPAGNELTVAEIRTILSDARDLGVSIVALAGGKPSRSQKMLDVAAASRTCCSR